MDGFHFNLLEQLIRSIVVTYKIFIKAKLNKQANCYRLKVGRAAADLRPISKSVPVTNAIKFM